MPLKTLGFYKGERTSKKERRASSKQPKAFDCEQCGLYKDEGLSNPKIKPFGDFRKEAMIWAEGPGKKEDRRGRPLCGDVGQYLEKYFPRHDLDMDMDCVLVNAVDCRPTDSAGANRKPTSMEIKCCYARKQKILEDYKPKVIFLLGDSAIESFYTNDPYRKAGTRTHKGSLIGLAACRGKVIPDRQLQAWVCHSYHPSYLVRGNYDKEKVFELDFAVFASMVGKPRPNFNLHENNVKILYEFEEVIALIDDIHTDADICTIDYETSSYRYHEKIHTIHLIGLAWSSNQAYVFPYDFKQSDGKPWWNKYQLKKIAGRWRIFLKKDFPKAAQNIKHEDRASRAIFGTSVNGWVHDTMIGCHVLDESKFVTGLKTQVYMNWGYHYG